MLPRTAGSVLPSVFQTVHSTGQDVSHDLLTTSEHLKLSIYESLDSPVPYVIQMKIDCESIELSSDTNTYGSYDLSVIICQVVLDDFSSEGAALAK